MSKKLDSTIRKIERVRTRFNELHVIGQKVKGKVIRMRYDDAIKQVAEECFYAPSTVQAILKGQYLSYDSKSEE